MLYMAFVSSHMLSNFDHQEEENDEISEQKEVSN